VGGVAVGVVVSAVDYAVVVDMVRLVSSMVNSAVVDCAVVDEWTAAAGDPV
jgi:hypothetical protein